MKKIIISLFLVLPFLVKAQSNEGSKKADTVYKRIFYLGYNYQNQSFNNLNSRLASLGSAYEKVPQSIFGFSTGVISMKNNFLSKMNFSFGTAFKRNEEKRNTELFAFQSSIEFGYNFSKNRNIQFYPLVGIGVSTFNVRLYKDLSSINFNDILQSPTVQASTSPVKLANTFGNYKVGFEVDFLNRSGFRALAIIAGYSGSFEQSSWKVNKTQEVANAPADGLSQFFVGLNFLMQRNRTRN